MLLEPIMSEPPLWQSRSVLQQRWTELAYFHWRYDPDSVQRLLPTDVRVDTFDGSAWVGLIPFEMRDVQLGPMPPLPWLASFIEINVRTYVVDALGRRSVWFFSLDVPRAAIVAVARTAFALPYCWARAEHTTHDDLHRYRMTRRWPRRSRPSADLSFRVGSLFSDDDLGELEHFLTARWGLLTTRSEKLLHGAVDHQRWPLHEVHDVRIEQEIIESAGLPSPLGPPHAMYSPGVDVRVAWFDTVPPKERP